MTAIGEAFADGMRSWWAPRLNEVADPDTRTVDAWLAKGSYACVSYNPGQPSGNGLPAAKETLTLNVANPLDLTHAFASEIARFSCAAYESVVDSSPPASAPKSLGWSVVRHYYASFYCAHALLRATGSALNYISGTTASTVNSIAGQYLGVQPTLKSGIYLTRFDRATPQKIIITKISGTSGSHDDMWEIFLQFVKDAEAEITQKLGRSSPGPDGAAQILDELRKCFKTSGWASSLRNAINYRQDHGVWFPWTRREKEIAAVTSRMQLWRPDAISGLQFSTTADEIVRLTEVCNVLIHLMTALLKDIVNRSQCRNGCFVDRRPFRYLKSRKILI